MKRFKYYLFILVSAMTVGRITAGFTLYVISTLSGLKIDVSVFIKAMLITGIPGIVIQLIFLPMPF